MQVEGITWYAVTLEDDEFAAMKKLVVEVFGLTPLIDQEGWGPLPDGERHSPRPLCTGRHS
jgi:hypothetical protein